ncbi:bromodomain-containing protein [Mycena olivaceomarginata]|nr:bromodomain-containing protein [Mycena olivaceomarginata]
MSRSRRSKSQVSAAAEGVSVLDKLVLAQAVWEVGTSSWLKISRILGKHPLLTHPKTFFTAQSCHAMYNFMMKESGFDLSDANNVAHAPIHFKLAEKYYAERVEELRTLISVEEQQFKAIVAEIDQIRAGQKDEEIKAKITGVPDKEQEEDTLDVPVDAPGATPQDEVPEIELPAADSETVQQEDPAVDTPVVPPTPEAAKVEDVAPQQDGTKASAEPTPTPDAPLSPAENLDHLMQVSDDEKPPEDVEVPEPVPEEPAVDIPSEQAVVEEEVVEEAVVEEVVVEEVVVPPEDTGPVAEDIKTEPMDMPNDGEDVDQSQSKPVSQASESGPAAEEGISTRRSTRRRPSISTASASVPPKKRGRRAKTPEVEVEAEQMSTPAAAVKEATPAMEEAQPDEEMPLSAAVRRRDGKRKASFFGGVDSPRANKRAREDSEPVDDDEQGSSSTALRRRPTGRTEEQVALKRFQTVITMVHSQISQHRNGNIFHNPIKVSEAPDYHDIVKRPIDLKTIKAKIKDGVIGNSLEYQRDIYLMFANAMMYNRPGSDVHVMAEDMMVESDSHINTFRQTEGYVKSR